MPLDEELPPDMEQDLLERDFSSPRKQNVRDPKAKKMIERSLTGRSITKQVRSRLLQLMAMTAARKNSSGGGLSDG